MKRNQEELIQQSVEEHRRKKMKLIEELRRENDPNTSSLSEELNHYLQAEKESLEYDIASTSSLGLTLPSQEEIMRLVLEEKKKHLLQQFVF